MKLNKNPGLDGLTVEFYLQFWDDISGLLLNPFHEGFEREEMTTLQKQCVIPLLF